jgi:hypothetical protein
MITPKKTFPRYQAAFAQATEKLKQEIFTSFDRGKPTHTERLPYANKK